MLKRDIRLFIRCLIPATVLTAVFAAVCAVAAFSVITGVEDTFTPVKTAVVDGEKSVLSRLVVGMVARMDYISDAMEVTVCDMDTAMEGLEQGDYAAVITFPAGTMDGIMYGDVTKGTIYLSPSAAAHTDVVAKTAAFGEVILAAGQYAIFSGEKLIEENNLSREFRSDFLDRYNQYLMTEALRAGSTYFQIQITDYADTNMSTGAYYAVCWLSLLLVLLPILFSGLYTADLNKPILSRLRSDGVKDAGFLFGKWLLPFVFMLVFVTAALPVAGKFAGISLTPGGIVPGTAGVVLAAVWGYILVASKHGVPVAAAVSAAGLLLSGGLIPRQMLPEALLLLGSVTPYGTVQNLLMPLFGGNCRLLPLLAGIGYLILLPILAKRRLCRIRTGGDGE